MHAKLSVSCECESQSVVSGSLQPIGLYSPWNSPGQNTGVGSHSASVTWRKPGVNFDSCMLDVCLWPLLLSWKWKSLSRVSLFVTPGTVLYSLWNSLGQNTRVGSLSLLQWIFPTQGLDPHLLHCRQILYQLSHKGSPRILEWVAIPSPADLPDLGMELGSPALQWILYHWSMGKSFVIIITHICLP